MRREAASPEPWGGGPAGVCVWEGLLHGGRGHRHFGWAASVQPSLLCPFGLWGGHDWDPSQSFHSIAHTQWLAYTGVSGPISASGIQDQPALLSEVTLS